MPKALEAKLKKQYRKKGLKGKKLDNAVYGTMTNIEKKQGKDMHGNSLKRHKKAMKKKMGRRI